MQRITRKGDIVAHIRENVPMGSDAPAEEIIDVPAEDTLNTPNWGLKESARKKRVRSLIPYLITAIVFSTLAFGAGVRLGSKQNAVDKTALIMSGGLAVDEHTLRALVVAKGLSVYWLGPKVGTKYLLNTSFESGISLRYISSDISSAGTYDTYYEIGTFVSPDAFALTQKAALQPNGVGFVNMDGNAVYYDSRDPKNIYVGLKGADIQIQIFDSRPDQALAAALLQGSIQKIT